MSSTRSRSALVKPTVATSISRVAGTRKSSQHARSEHGIRHTTPADGNIFADLGSPPAEAANLLARSQLMIRLEQLIKKRKLTQLQAARLLGVSQPRVSDLVRGRIDRFSVDTLIEMLARAGLNVEISVTPRAA